MCVYVCVCVCGGGGGGVGGWGGGVTRHVVYVIRMANNVHGHHIYYCFSVFFSLFFLYVVCSERERERKKINR